MQSCLPPPTDTMSVVIIVVDMCGEMVAGRVKDDPAFDAATIGISGGGEGG
jgi:hypothetical protein